MAIDSVMRFIWLSTAYFEHCCNLLCLDDVILESLVARVS